MSSNLLYFFAVQKFLAIILVAGVLLVSPILAIRFFLDNSSSWNKLVKEGVVDLTRLESRDTPNIYWISPPGYAPLPPMAKSPIYDMSAVDLNKKLRAIINAEPRITWVADKGLRFELTQKTALLRWPDYVTVEIIALDADRSTLAVYSRARFGIRDFGVNKARVERWLRKLN